MLGKRVNLFYAPVSKLVEKKKINICGTFHKVKNISDLSCLIDKAVETAKCMLGSTIAL